MNTGNAGKAKMLFFESLKYIIKLEETKATDLAWLDILL